MHRRVYLATAGSAALAGLAGCTVVGDVGEQVFGEPEYDIGMTRNEFLPAEYETTVGEPVVWKNTSESIHTITAIEGRLPDEAEYFATGGYDDQESAEDAWHDNHGGAIGIRETYEYTFEVPGTYHYICVPHVGGGMVGRVVVTE
ncbi:cupredoxin domain-containing protein [Natronosalvus caseinilyticus]|uniref:cupredoxin domain-containing protein n=1 Tax=Natronosalvus caseinilyticus TaxID=2953747 RepID=UPI0028AC5A09|nr:plastocyanin/azurin family copper-binding protein [Natronosalvus caseinilyticus]